MGFFNKYPYTDFHELNLDWVLNMLKELDKEWDEFKVLNTITIAGVWDISKNYPKYAIVEDSGTGYLSLKPVPVGIAINNLDYWLPVGTYSTAIADLNTRLTAAEGNITTLQGTVANHTTAINALNPIKEVYDYLSGTIICIGDSYLQGFSPDGDTTPWGTWIRDWFNKSGEYYAYADGGAGFVKTGINSKRFEDLLQDAINNTSINKNNVSLIIFGGGFNDAWIGASSSDIYNRMNNCMTLIRNNYPNATTIVAHVGNCNATSGLTYDKLYQNIYRYGNGATSNGFKYIGDAGFALKANGAAPTLASDGVHPTDGGQQQIAMAIVNAIGNQGYTGFNVLYNNTNDHIFGISGKDGVFINCFLDQNIDFTPANITCDGTNFLVDIDISGMNITPLMGSQYLMFRTSVGITTTDSKFYMTDAYCRIKSDGHLVMAPHAFAEDHSGYLSISNARRITIFPQVIAYLPRELC